MSDAEPSGTHLTDDGLWIPPELREFDGQIVFRTPATTIQHFQSGGGDLEGYYPMIGQRHFGPVDELDDPQNPDLAPDQVSVKLQGEDAIVLDVELNPDVKCDGGASVDDAERSAISEVKVRETSIDDHIIADCPLCLDPMLLGDIWRELILEDDRDIPPCPDCDDGTGDSWADEADVKLDATEFWALSGDVIKTVRPAFDKGDESGDSDE